MTTPKQVREALREVIDPCSAAAGSNLDIVEMGLVKSIEVSDGHVDIEMRLTTPVCHMVAYFIDEISTHVGSLSDIDSVNLETDDGCEWTEAMLSEEAEEKRQRVLDEHESRYREELAVE